MFDFIDKKSKKAKDKQSEPPVMNTEGRGSLLDVVVPFKRDDASGAPGSHNSLLSQIEGLARKRDEMLVEKQETERAELRAKRAAFESAERQSRMEMEREESIRFEEKAERLAQEIERVREGKVRNSNPHSAVENSSNHENHACHPTVCKL